MLGPLYIPALGNEAWKFHLLCLGKREVCSGSLNLQDLEAVPVVTPQTMFHMKPKHWNSGMRHMRVLGSSSRANSNTSPCFSAADEEVVCTKKVRSETDVLGEAGDGNSSHVRHHTHMDWRLLWEFLQTPTTFPAGCGELSVVEFL